MSHPTNIVFHSQQTLFICVASVSTILTIDFMDFEMITTTSAYCPEFQHKTWSYTDSQYPSIYSLVIRTAW